MRGSDLMLGDWVYLSDVAKYPMQVTLIDEGGCYLNFEGNEGDPFEGDFDDESGVCPIELRDDLLLLNKFDNAGEGVFALPGHPDFRIRKIGDNLVLRVGKKKLAILRYVHQLQHLLRFIGEYRAANHFQVC